MYNQKEIVYVYMNKLETYLTSKKQLLKNRFGIISKAITVSSPYDYKVFNYEVQLTQDKLNMAINTNNSVFNIVNITELIDVLDSLYNKQLLTEEEYKTNLKIIKHQIELINNQD